MTRDDILRMAREAHSELVTQDYPGHAGQLDPWTVRLLERFAALVAAAERDKLEPAFKQLEALMQVRETQPNKPCCLAEREACAKVCEGQIGGAVRADQWWWWNGFKEATRQCASAIRARSKG